MMDSYTNLMTRIQQRSAKSVVIGLGYVGLPLAVLHAQAGFSVTGIERNPSRVERVNRGESYIEEVADSDLRPLVRQGQIVATSEFDSISDADIIAICVPTPIDINKQPNTSYIKQVIDLAGPYLRASQLIVLESTTYLLATSESGTL